MFLRFLLFFCCLSIGLPILAQPNWQPATLKLTDGMDIRGELDDRHWSFHFDDLRYRVGAKQEVRRYPLTKVNKFAINGRRYEVHEVTINSSPREPRQLVSQEDRQEDKLTAALLVLVEGSISLYEYADARGNAHFFIRRIGYPLEYLDYGRYKVASYNGSTTYTEVSPFRTTLVGALSNCERIRQDILKAKYRREALLDIFERYYNCGQERSGYWLPREAGVWQFGPDLGMVKGNPTYGEIQKPIFPFRRLSDWSPGIGAHAKYRFGGPHGSVAIRFGVWYHSFDVATTLPDPDEEDPAANANFQYLYNERSVHFQLGPEVVLVRSRYPIFLETMAEYHQILDYQESRFLTRTVNGQTTAEGVAYDFSNRGAFSLTLGAGIIAGRTRFSLRGTATRRKYDTYLLNLYRVSLVGSMDF
ncbi:MAG: hypothetical protein AAF840_04310 [Bacteroidota bacterium]